MVREIRVYIESGGNRRYRRYGKNRIREGFHKFMEDAITRARARNISWQIVACGSRDSAFDDFKTGLNYHRDAFNILLVDSEGSVAQGESPEHHLRERDNWVQPPGVQGDQIHLMVEMMEAWFIADITTILRSK